MDGQEVDMYYNYDLKSIVTPIKVNEYERLLILTNFDSNKRQQLTESFRNGFDIGYRGPTMRKSEAKNIPVTEGVGDSIELWNKIMKEVKLGRYAGPYIKPPFENYIQSPVGLIPKSGGKTRLIFHLSYMFSEDEPSVNDCIPEDLRTVKYKDLNFAIKTSLRLMRRRAARKLFYGKTDLVSDTTR